MRARSAITVVTKMEKEKIWLNLLILQQNQSYQIKSNTHTEEYEVNTRDVYVPSSVTILEAIMTTINTNGVIKVTPANKHT